jgi:hypothetical protein
MTLVLAKEPGFTDIADTAFDPGQAATDTDLKALNDNAKFAAVRSEEFWGYYQHGETVALPVSLADGYQYAREELLYAWAVVWTGAGPGNLNGTQEAPTPGATSGAGVVLQMGFSVNQGTGEVSCVVSYWKDSVGQSNTNDGILLVHTFAKRAR